MFYNIIYNDILYIKYNHNMYMFDNILTKLCIYINITMITNLMIICDKYNIYIIYYNIY